jgi:enoyl-CoA hydratase/carnithine racemase
MNESILSRREGPVLVLINNNRAERNALTPTFFEEMPLHLERAQADSEIVAIVLTGAGDFFCSGGSLQGLAMCNRLEPTERRAQIEKLNDLIRAMRNCSKPLIAAVEGGATGAGVSLALACDMLVMERKAYFSISYVKVGLTPDGGATALLAEYASRQLLTELCLTGDRISADRLAQLGALNRLVEPGQAEAEAIALAARLADGPPRAMSRIKALCRRAHGAGLDDQLELEALHMVNSMGDPEAAEGIAAFFSKRPARFRARPEAAK